MRFSMPIRLAVTLAAVTVPAAAAAAQCGPSGCVTRPSQEPPQAVRSAFESAVRVVHATSGGVSLGSGAFVGRSGSNSVVLTCAHLFDANGRTSVIVNGTRFNARVIALDRAHDLALLQTSARPRRIASVSRQTHSGVLTACGFGPSGAFRHVSGRVVGSAVAQGAEWPSLRIQGSVRSGDSGGPVFDVAGRLAAVVWGCRGGETFAIGGPPLQRILDRTKNDRPLTPIAREPRDADSAQPNKERLRSIEREVSDVAARLDERFVNANEAIRDIALRVESRLDEFERLVKQRAERPSSRINGFLHPMPLDALTRFGGPAAVAVGAMAWWLRHRTVTQRDSRIRAVRDRPDSTPVAVDSPPPPQRVVPETHYVSYEKDDFARAHQWASEQLSRKFPGSVELLTSLDSLIRQKLNGAASS